MNSVFVFQSYLSSLQIVCKFNFNNRWECLNQHYFTKRSSSKMLQRPLVWVQNVSMVTSKSKKQQQQKKNGYKPAGKQYSVWTQSTYIWNRSRNQKSTQTTVKESTGDRCIDHGERENHQPEIDASINAYEHWIIYRIDSTVASPWRRPAPTPRQRRPP